MSLAIDLGLGPRLLAAADTYRALGESRPHRRAYHADESAEILRRAAGCRIGREVDVLRHVASGLSNRRIAELLSISEKTVRKHIYAKAGVSNRTAAGLFALEHGIKGPSPPVADQRRR